MTSRILVALRVPASPERAFSAFTEDIGRWWRPNSLFPFTSRDPGVLSFECGAAGRLIETRTNGKVFEIGRIQVWNPPKKLVFGWRQANFAPGQATVVEVSFEAQGEETRIVVEHRGWDSVPLGHVARHGFPEQAFLQRHAEWWGDHLHNIKNDLARRAEPIQ